MSAARRGGQHPPMKRNDRAITGFAMLAHATFHTYEMAIPVFVVVWLDAFAVSEALLGTVVGVGYALIGLGAIPSGALSDVYGSKPLVLASMLGMGAGFILLSIAPTVAVLALAMVAWGIGASVYHPAGLSLLSRGTEQRGTAFAYHGAADNVGTVIGPLAAAVLLAFLEWRLVALVFVLPALVGTLAANQLDFEDAAVLSTAVEGDSDAVEADGGMASPRELLADARVLFSGGFVVLFALIVFYGLYYRGVLTFLPEILAGLSAFQPVELAGREFEPSQYAFAGLLLVGVFGQYLGGRLSDAGDSERTLVIGFAALALATLAFVPASDAGLVPLLAVVVALGFLIYVVVPVYQASIADHVDDGSHGLSYGLTYLGMFGIGALGASLAGVALSYAGPPVLFTVLAGLAAVAGGLAAYLRVR